MFSKTIFQGTAIHTPSAYLLSSLSLFSVIVLSFCRWRDVKLRAFDNAKHRTYVDLKV